MPIDKLEYIFDPLCGWCYASAPALDWLAATFSHQLYLLPSGLFAGEGARPITPEWAAHAWKNDQRIAQLTGQPFSGQYHHLLLSGARFDSGALNLALTAFRQISSAAEAGLLHELQAARYVRGEDTARGDVVLKISQAYAAVHHPHLSPSLTADIFAPGSELADLTQQRISGVQRLMRSNGISGVPLLLVTVAGKTHAISGSDLYGGAESINNALDKLGCISH
ncbi:protein-disulfide isomerase [Erwinia sp. E602]|uniref:DsbA family protein n=1 Tax=Erwinia sp. E602 TaxID=2675378 RepID=UPI001BAB173F|nr:protein-disulfide isomerase [Erwinia sp. E602]QUG75244.1 protein-disulfide isomerase [Erwinia sp. E602]